MNKTQNNRSKIFKDLVEIKHNLTKHIQIQNSKLPKVIKIYLFDVSY